MCFFCSFSPHTLDSREGVRTSVSNASSFGVHFLDLRMALLVDPVIGAIFGVALPGLLEAVKIIASSKTSGKELKEKLLSIKPTLEQISSNISDSDTSPNSHNPFNKFQVILQEGVHLVDTLEKIRVFDVRRKYQYGMKIRKFQRELFDFLVTQVPLIIALGMQKLQKQDADFKVCFQRFELENKEAIAGSTSQFNKILQKLDADFKVCFQRFELENKEAIAGLTSQFNKIQLCQTSTGHQGISSTSQVPDMPNYVVGLGNRINDVKQILLQKDVNVVGIVGLGGSGKTTLASAVCNDTVVKELFQDNMIFITVSRLDGNANGVSEVLEVMWSKIVGGQVPRFRSIEDAHNQLQKKLKSQMPHFRSIENAHNQPQKKLKTERDRPILVVLDDVWSESNLEPLLFQAEGYKTIVTTRQDSTIKITDSTRRLYNMNMLEEANALSLFCFWAFGHTSIPTTAKENLVKEVAAECKGLPLALKVIGSCLRGQPQPVWRSAREKLSRAEQISDTHRDELLNRLKTSIDILDDVQRQCFLDLGAFPKGKKNSVDSLLNIWVYVHGLDWDDAFVVLLELSERHLLNLTSNPGSSATDYSCASGLCFSQHDGIRDLAFHLASQDSIIHRKRLFMPRKEDNIPTEWQRTLTNQQSAAQFLSIHTGAMQEQDWCQIHFPEVEALFLFFAASHFCLPTFLQTMPKLKVLIIYNYSSQRAILSGQPSFPSPVQIRSVLLNKLYVPPSLYENCRSWERLEKLHVCLCEGLGNISILDKEHETLNFPNIVEINIDHCSDLRKLPAKLCNFTSLQMLSVTDCHLIQKLPDGLGRLSSLRVLRLSACPSLSRLPLSICNLGKLEYLDISLCSSLKDLPSKFDELSNLEILDMRECSGLKKLRKVNLKSLKRIIISYPEAKEEWLSFPNLVIDLVGERFGLDWLDD